MNVGEDVAGIGENAAGIAGMDGVGGGAGVTGVEGAGHGAGDSAVAEGATADATDETIGTPPFEAPSAAKATHILRTLKWGEHYLATEMNSSSGSRQIYLYSLTEAARFLNGEAAGSAVTEGRRGMICWVEKDEFIAWIGEVIGDEALADAIIEALTEQMTGFDEVVAMHTLISIRVEQLRGLVEP
jgi:hypothetical protein